MRDDAAGDLVSALSRQYAHIGVCERMGCARVFLPRAVLIFFRGSRVVVTCASHSEATRVMSQFAAVHVDLTTLKVTNVFVAGRVAVAPGVVNLKAARGAAPPEMRARFGVGRSSALRLRIGRLTVDLHRSGKFTAKGGGEDLPPLAELHRQLKDFVQRTQTK